MTGWLSGTSAIVELASTLVKGVKNTVSSVVLKVHKGPMRR